MGPIKGRKYIMDLTNKKILEELAKYTELYKKVNNRQIIMMV